MFNDESVPNEKIEELKNNPAFQELQKLHDEGVEYADILHIALENEAWKDKYNLQPGDLKIMKQLIYKNIDLNDVENNIRYGLVGEIVEKFAPHTEASTIAIAAQFLTAFGNVVGRTSYIRVGATIHNLNLFILIVGTSSKSRKGTSWDFLFTISLKTTQKHLHGYKII